MNKKFFKKIWDYLSFSWYHEEIIVNDFDRLDDGLYDRKKNN